MEKEIKKSIKIIKKNISNLIAVYVFGSFAKSVQTKKSDLDLAVLPKEKLNPIFLWELSKKISFKIKRDVDLIDLLDANTVLRFQIINEGELFYCKDKNKCAFFENTTDSMYLDFNYIRKKIIENIIKRKKIF